jgi:hypothetical protein
MNHPADEAEAEILGGLRQSGGAANARKTLTV